MNGKGVALNVALKGPWPSAFLAATLNQYSSPICRIPKPLLALEISLKMRVPLVMTVLTSVVFILP